MTAASDPSPPNAGHVGLAEAQAPFQSVERSAALSALEEAQAILRAYVDPSDSLSEELIRERREAAARGD